MRSIKESLFTPVRYDCDVLVVGGGFAGIAAAIAAAREGKQVILADRGFLLGGLATAGLVTIYLPLCDGMGHQVSFGLAEALLRLSVSECCDGQRGVNDWLHSDDKKRRGPTSPRFDANFNPQLFAILAEQELISLGVKLFYGIFAVAVNKVNGRIREVVFEGKSGRFSISARTIVDATGDADIAHFAEAPTVRFGQGNVLAAWYYSNSGDKNYQLHMLGFSDTPDEEQAKGQPTPSRLVERRFSGLDDEENSEMCILSHAAILRDLQSKWEAAPDMEPVTLATIPQLRMTRRIVGEYTLSSEEMHKRFNDSIGMVSDWRKRGPIYEVPFRTLYSKSVRNLITAGRCTSVTDGMWDVMRVIPCCAVTGEAAGLAAALTDDFAALDITVLQKKLIANSVVLHESDL